MGCSFLSAGVPGTADGGWIPSSFPDCGGIMNRRSGQPLFDRSFTIASAGRSCRQKPPLIPGVFS